MQIGTAETLQIIQIVVYVGAAIYFVAMIKADIKIVKHDMSIMKLRQDSLSDALKQLTSILTQVAVQDTRIGGLEEDIRELKHGKGFIRTSIEGEYDVHGKVRK